MTSPFSIRRTSSASDTPANYAMLSGRAEGGRDLVADVGLYTCNASTGQQWVVQDRGSGWFSLRNIAGNTCLDNYNWDAANGARLSLYPCNGLAAQLWRLGWPNDRSVKITAHL